jgi:hypothetical protein
MAATKGFQGTAPIESFDTAKAESVIVGVHGVPVLVRSKAGQNQRAQL